MLTSGISAAHMYMSLYATMLNLIFLPNVLKVSLFLVCFKQNTYILLLHEVFFFKAGMVQKCNEHINTAQIMCYLI